MSAEHSWVILIQSLRVCNIHPLPMITDVCMCVHLAKLILLAPWRILVAKATNSEALSVTAGRPAKSEVKQIDSQFNPQELIKTFSNQHQTIEHKSLGEPGTRNVSATIRDKITVGVGNLHVVWY